MKKLILMLFVITTLISCTENQRSKNFGGNMIIDVPKGNKVTNITWKKDELWYSFRPFQEGEIPVTTSFVEKSSWDIWEGTVTFKESR